MDLPGGAVGKSLPASAGDTGSIPGLGRSHTQQSNEVHTPQPPKPVHREPVLCNKRSQGNAKPTCHNDEWPPLPQLGKAPANEDPVQPKTKITWD